MSNTRTRTRTLRLDEEQLDEKRANKCVRELRLLTHDELKRASQNYNDFVAAACLDDGLLSIAKEDDLSSVLKKYKVSLDPDKTLIYEAILATKFFLLKEKRNQLPSPLLAAVERMLLCPKTTQATYKALLGILKEAWGPESEAIRKIEITREKLGVIKRLASFLKDEKGATDHNKIDSYSKCLIEIDTIKTLSQHRDADSEKMDNHPFLFAVCAVLSVIGIVLAPLFFFYKAVDSSCKYGSVSFFSPNSKNMMNAAAQHIDEYNKPANGVVSPKQ